MRSPFSYWGGKQNMLNVILPLMPSHIHYVEPFAGGAALFWAKDESKAETINDINGLVVNFYRQLANNFEALEDKILLTVYSREEYDRALFVVNNALYFSEIEKALAFWTAISMSFGAILGSGFSYSATNKHAIRLANRKKEFTEVLSQRLERTVIENIDAIKLIETRDRMSGSNEFFYYIDPPYMNASQGHYAGYTEKDFWNLLVCLESIKGKFLLSCYYSVEVQYIADKNGWLIQKIVMPLCASNLSAGTKRRTKSECLVRNYQN